VHALVPRPSAGRVFETDVRVRFSDADPSGRLRLDALARLLQDVGNDDFTDAGVDPLSPWVARRSVVVASAWPRLGEQVRASTWCGGLGGRWAERRTSMGSVEIATLWVHLDAAGRPARIPAWFRTIYGDAAEGREVSARLSLPAPPPGAMRRPWPQRAVDLDVFGHVNNTVTWAAVEEACALAGIVPGTATLEYVGAIDPGDEAELVIDRRSGIVDAWLVVGEQVRAAARIYGA
jgi:acyl-ACP thioesterase